MWLLAYWNEKQKRVMKTITEYINESVFDKNFIPTFLKRIRAYDNNGMEFDIEMNFRILENKRYVSDGDSDTIITSSENESIVNNINNLKVIYY